MDPNTWILSILLKWIIIKMFDMIFDHIASSFGYILSHLDMSTMNNGAFFLFLWSYYKNTFNFEISKWDIYIYNTDTYDNHNIISNHP